MVSGSDGGQESITSWGKIIQSRGQYCLLFFTPKHTPIILLSLPMSQNV